MRTVMRIIGFRPGTGGSSGVGLLKQALDLTFFPELFAVRTVVGPARCVEVRKAVRWLRKQRRPDRGMRPGSKGIHAVPAPTSKDRPHIVYGTVCPCV